MGTMSEWTLIIVRSDSLTLLQRKCDYLDGEIDKLVYELYGLTVEEIGIVEGNLK